MIVPAFETMASPQILKVVENAGGCFRYARTLYEALRLRRVIPWNSVHVGTCAHDSLTTPTMALEYLILNQGTIDRL